uniref:NADH dehydrogenase subunit 2 n=1 Tax=Plecia hardyi TaxID=3097417 RepID=UPI002E7A87B7|nr:NADH dehydrogenase subunit 2 [Plecia hardyi]WPM86388.1 NADH dehydrogenase subunit 2 [Plecia hardyi]
MYKNLSKLLFLFMLISSSIIVISANSWLSAWMALEINLLSFIPLMINSKSMMSTESSLKYFLTQVMASSLLLFFIIMSFLNLNFMFQLFYFFNNKMMYIIITLMIKSGVAPLHFWFPSVVEGISWMNIMLLMTWQKIAPLMLISYSLMNNNKNILFIFIIMSSLIGSMQGLNQTSLKKLMAYSSINHLSWILAAMMLNNNLWMIYFLLYSFMSFLLIYFFYIFNLFFINQINYMKNMKSIKFIFFMNLMSLGGLPPFLGFIPKWLVIQNLIFNKFYFLTLFMIMMTLITLFFYLRISFSTFMMNSSNLHWQVLKNYNNKNFNFIIMLSFVNLSNLILFINFMFMIF